MRPRHLLYLCILSLVLVLPAQASRILVRTVTCEGAPINYFLTLPLGESGPSAKLPAVLLLHGAGDKPAPMIDAWHSLADKEKIILIAPELPRTREFEDIAPRVFHCIVEDTKQAAQLDPKRIYVFGNSMVDISPTMQWLFSRSILPLWVFTPWARTTITTITQSPQKSTRTPGSSSSASTFHSRRSRFSAYWPIFRWALFFGAALSLPLGLPVS